MWMMCMAFMLHLSVIWIWMYWTHILGTPPMHFVVSLTLDEDDAQSYVERHKESHESLHLEDDG